MHFVTFDENDYFLYILRKIKNKKEKYSFSVKKIRMERKRQIYKKLNMGPFLEEKTYFKTRFVFL